MRERINKFCRDNGDTILIGSFVAVAGATVYVILNAASSVDGNLTERVETVMKGEKIVKQIVTYRNGKTATYETDYLED